MEKLQTGLSLQAAGGLGLEVWVLFLKLVRYFYYYSIAKFNGKINFKARDPSVEICPHSSGVLHKLLPKENNLK